MLKITVNKMNDSKDVFEDINFSKFRLRSFAADRCKKTINYDDLVVLNSIAQLINFVHVCSIAKLRIYTIFKQI